jgi:uncharacterized protein YndB with AHSA1/START domain
MAKLEKTVTIKAPVEKVFSYMTDPRHYPEIWPSMVEVKDVTPSPKGGNDFNWVYKMGGMRFEGTSVEIEHIANQRIVAENTKGIPSKFTWTYKPEAGGTMMTVEVEYTVPIPLLGKLAESVIVKLNENEMNVLLANLKARMEA